MLKAFLSPNQLRQSIAHRMPSVTERKQTRPEKVTVIFIGKLSGYGHKLQPE